MAEKSSQHLLPVVYQRAFADHARPPALPASAPFEPRVWLIPRTLRSPGRAKAPKNAFVATRFYNLAADDPRRPIVEEGLSRLEARYGALLPVLAARAEPKLTQFIDLVVFVGGLRFRMPGQIDHWQKQYDDLARIHRHVERANTGAESQSDRMFGVQGDMAKRLLLGNAGSYAKVVAPGGWSS